MNTEQIVSLAMVYSGHAGLTLSTVSTYAANDGKWLPNLKAGTASCTLRKAAAVVGWFNDNWPADLAWPRDIPRPSKSKEAA